VKLHIGEEKEFFPFSYPVTFQKYVVLKANRSELKIFLTTVATLGISLLSAPDPRKTSNESQLEIQVNLAVITFCPVALSAGVTRLILPLFSQDCTINMVIRPADAKEYIDFLMEAYL
jgi:hypothetical protein